MFQSALVLMPQRAAAPAALLFLFTGPSCSNVLSFQLSRAGVDTPLPLLKVLKGTLLTRSSQFVGLELGREVASSLVRRVQQ